MTTTDITRVAEQLRLYAQHIERWREEARQLRIRADDLSFENAADTESLVGVERTAGDIYNEIASFKQTVTQIAETSPAAAGELAEVGETLHLLLLDITELGIKMYGTRSGVSFAGAPAGGSTLSASEPVSEKAGA